MDRSAHRRYATSAAGLVVAAGLLFQAGCAAPLAGILWAVKGDNVPAECKLLEKKRVAVVCRAAPGQKYSSTLAARDLATRVGLLLKTNGKKIEVVDQREVAKWTDENQWEDPEEVGKAVDADMVVSIDLEDFRLYEGPTLFRGKCNVVCKVYDLEKDNELVFEKFPPQIMYPENTGVPISDRQEPQFQREFLDRVAQLISQSFYEYDSRKSFAPDMLAFQ